MTDAELQGEQLTVLPLRLETIHWRRGGDFDFRGGDVDQDARIFQSNRSNQEDGFFQFNRQSNWANIDQDVDQDFRFRR